MLLARLGPRLAVIVFPVLLHSLPTASLNLRHDCRFGSGPPAFSSPYNLSAVSLLPFSTCSLAWPLGIQVPRAPPTTELVMSRATIDVLAATASDLQDMLSNGATTSVELVDLYLEQIDKHNHRGLHLNGVIETAPRSLLIQRAQELDAERASGVIRGKLHGIPIIVKVRRSGTKIFHYFVDKPRTISAHILLLV